MGTDFTQGEVMPLLFKFFLPFLLANLLNSIYNTVDTIIIGQFVGSSGIVAVTMGGKMLNLFTNIGLAFAGGGQVLIAQLVGAKRRDELNATIGTLFSEMFGLSVIFAVVTLLLSRNIITWLNTPAEAFESAVVYLRITCVGLPLIFGYNAVSSVLRFKKPADFYRHCGLHQSDRRSDLHHRLPHGRRGDRDRHRARSGCEPALFAERTIPQTGALRL